MIKSYGINTLGRDFICSDIHGHFHLLEEKLQEHNFDKSKDRLFSLGDLIDRGEGSKNTLEWLREPWFHAIKGNHEQMLIETVESMSQSDRDLWIMWGGDWIESVSEELLKAFYKVFCQLPLAIELQLSNTKSVGLVHAELPDICDWEELKECIKTLSSNKVSGTGLDYTMLWERSQPKLDDEQVKRVEAVSQVDHVFHGHTIVEEYLTIKNRTFMDLGTYKTGKIGFIEPLQFLNKS